MVLDVVLLYTDQAQLCCVASPHFGYHMAKRLKWGPEFLADLADEIFSKLPEETLQETVTYLQDQVWPWGSTCSGTDSPAFGFKGLAKSLSKRGVRFKQVHIFSAERERSKEDFIIRQAPPAEFFRDIHDVAHDHPAWCSIATTSGQREWAWRVADAGHEVKEYISGFSCKSVSGLAGSKQGTESCIDSASMQTGETFAGVEKYVKTRKPMCVILENVPGLRRNGQDLDVVRKIEALGYHGFSREINPVTWGIPQSRPRLWFVFVRCDIGGATFTQDEYVTHCDSIFDDISVGFPLMDIDDFLLPDSASAVRETRVACAERAQTICRGGSGDSKWVKRHAEMQKRRGMGSLLDSNWRPELSGLFPDYCALPDRYKELLAMRGVQFPHPSPLVLNVTQSDVSMGHGYTPTLTPKGLFWLSWRIRALRGSEALSLQCIHLNADDREHYLDSLLHDLAGNAFNAGCFLATQVVAFTVMAKMSKRARTTASGEGEPPNKIARFSGGV